ncbi:MAG: hypothetical protein ACXWQZ_24030 [Ktedonobacterales bacterium]
MVENTPPHDPTDLEDEFHGPFRDETDVMADPVAQHDDISKTQSSSDAAAEVSAEHVSELLYQPGYIFDPRSSPRGVEYNPAYPDSVEPDTTPAQTDEDAYKQKRGI